MPLVAENLDIMAALKAATASQHQAVEQLMPIFGPKLSLPVYARTVEAFLGFHEPVESRLAGIDGLSGAGIDLQVRSRALWLRADLRALGLTEADIARLPRCTELPRLETRDDGLGCLYVLEGSTLGGQLISRELERRLGIDENSGAGFFRSYGANVGAMWTDFCASVRGCVHTPQEQAAVVDAANNTFEAFENWMRKVGPYE